MPRRIPRTTVLCACGCGEEIVTPDPKARPRKFKRGHCARIDNVGLKVIAAMPKPMVGQHWRADGSHWRTSRARARTLVNIELCEWSHIGGCKGKIDAAHVDGDFTNGDASNIKALCRSHHRLLDNGRIDPANPVMPPFYVDISGNRRYQHDKARAKKQEGA